LLLFFGFVSCHEKPNFPDTPSISLNEFYFREINSGTGNNLQDSIVIKLKFEDGNGDLGLDGTETQPPYQLYDVVMQNGDSVRYGDEGAPAYNCYDYQIFTETTSVGDSLVVKADTVYVIRNLNHFNFFLTFLVEENGEFVEYNTYEKLCAGPFHGRFFILNTQGDVRPLTGELQYGFISIFRAAFRYDIIKLRIQIQDRELNKSNIIETDAFNISEIVRPPR
jgi:hypothetical protein